MAQRIKMVKYLDSNPPSGLDIRPVDKDRIREIAKIMLDSYIDTPDYEGESLNDTIKEISMVFRGYYGQFLEDASFLICNEEDEIVSCLFVCDFKNEATITYLFTRKDHLGRGFATALIHSAEHALLDKGYDRIFLFVSRNNNPAVQLYLNLGFMEIPLNTSPIDREFLKEVREWELNFSPIGDERTIAQIIDHEFEIDSTRPVESR
ncbi:GNAT family N-acetyltransferase [Proteiniclasticum sp. QWL-01]|uniref:GNAT family N-acetyltransferase n=1 Tax=Proteiniclasticum sp. QWL-01 TaxID=3036945 RepID=UPI0022005F72|nr:GNAT family N-acetyltransferase [Proteiniclasticum sp. QWL-01]UUM12975.1 GNAT family N-acetyltransferase [Clostridiaceae bacterium HFYG-1003]WFF71400.1 GNAT family N-acetyltransferase [Proteiniclasticum sp. QWL-01]